MSDLIAPHFDELYVVSDIHMGGPAGFQILKHGPRLGALIRHLATVRAGERVALVLNGDVVDSLAEDIDGYVAVDEAPRMMERIYRDPAFAPRSAWRWPPSCRAARRASSPGTPPSRRGRGWP
jgi:hypothetical protein